MQRLSVDFKETQGIFFWLCSTFISFPCCESFPFCDFLAYSAKLSEAKNSFRIRESVNFILFIVDVACSFFYCSQTKDIKIILMVLRDCEHIINV